MNFAGFHILVPAKGARGKIGNVPEAGVTGGIIYNDLTLGAYDDRFRLTLQWRSGSRALLGMSPLYRGAATGGYGVEIAASGVLRCQIVEVTPVSLGFDLDGDGKADLRLYDELTSPSWNGKDMPERDRNQTVRIVGTAVGGEKSFDFQIRSGLPMRAGFDTPENKTAASNAMAVSGLNEQRKNASYEAQFDQYEMAMMRVRADAAAAGTIGQPTYDAWRALSEDMIKLQPQQGPGGTVQQALEGYRGAACRCLQRGPVGRDIGGGGDQGELCRLGQGQPLHRRDHHPCARSSVPDHWHGSRTRRSYCRRALGAGLRGLLGPGQRP